MKFGVTEQLNIYILMIVVCNILCICKQMQGSKVNLIMTDYCMPGMSGYDLLKRVKVKLTFSHD